ncbi:MAG TPA: hypothetical protein P5309_02125 [Syntrophomonadaceae bacterium]|nr:hypothetical protein [Syntrophomonadaceae bacterium]
MILSKREKVLLGTLLLAGCAYLLDYFWLQPLNARSSQLHAENSSLQAELNQGTDMKARYGEADIQEKIIADYAAVRAQVPDQPMITDIIEFVGLIAAETGIEAHSVQYDAQIESRAEDGTEKQRLHEIKFKIQAQGTRSGLLIFLARIENAPRLFNVTKTILETVESHSSPVPSLAGGEKGDTPSIDASSILEESINPELDRYKLGMEISAFYRD